MVNEKILKSALRNVACIAAAFLISADRGMSIVSVATAAAAEVGAVAAGANPAESLTVRQTFHDRQRVVAQSVKSQSVQPGEEFIATLENQQQCPLRVVDVRANIITLDTTLCRFRESIRPGVVLERSLLANSAIGASADAPKAAMPSQQLPILPVSSGASVVPQNSAAPEPHTFRLIDLGYFPAEAESLVVGRIRRRQTNLTEKIRNSTIVASVSQNLSAEVGALYGISDRLVVGGTFAHSLSISRDDAYGPSSTSNGQSTTSVSRGLYDPEFEIGFRALENPMQGFRGIVGIMIKPKFGDAKFSASTHEGTVATGGNEVTLSAKMIRKGKLIEGEFGMSFLYKDKRESRNQVTSRTYTLTGQDIFTVAGTLSFTTTPESALYLGLRWSGMGSGKIEAPGTNSIVIGETSAATVALGFSTELLPQQVALRLEYIGQLEATAKLKENNSEWDAVQTANSVVVSLVSRF